MIQILASEVECITSTAERRGRWSLPFDSIASSFHCCNSFWKKKEEILVRIIEHVCTCCSLFYVPLLGQPIEICKPKSVQTLTEQRFAWAIDNAREKITINKYFILKIYQCQTTKQFWVGHTHLLYLSSKLSSLLYREAGLSVCTILQYWACRRVKPVRMPSSSLQKESLQSGERRERKSVKLRSIKGGFLAKITKKR